MAVFVIVGMVAAALWASNFGWIIEYNARNGYRVVAEAGSFELEYQRPDPLRVPNTLGFRIVHGWQGYRWWVAFAGSSEGWAVAIPFWMLVGASGAGLALMWWLNARLHALASRSRVCRKCNYSLADLVGVVVCPECGTSQMPVRVACGKIEVKTGVLIGTVILVLGLTGFFAVYWRASVEASPVVQVTQYKLMRNQVGNKVGEAAIGNLPAEIPMDAQGAAMWAFCSKSDDSASMLLRYRVSVEKAQALSATCRLRAVDGITHGDYRQVGFDVIMPNSDYGKLLPRSFETFLLFERVVSHGTDRISAGVLIDEQSGTVVWWARRWCAALN